MENASKALLIAGGILLAIITLSLVVYMMGAVKTMADAQDEKRLSEQITAFNREYESYNKRIMYGTDVITVVNKAIEHNKKVGLITVDPYYINIKIKPIQEFETIVIKIDNSTPDSITKTLTFQTDLTEIQGVFGAANTGVGYLKPNITYSLGNYNGENFVTDNNFEKFFEGDKTDKTYKDEPNKLTYKMYSALTNFKTAIFECTDVVYSQETGRIKEMKFEQTKSATH